jgi:hypothetical protein
LSDEYLAALAKFRLSVRPTQVLLARFTVPLWIRIKEAVGKHWAVAYGPFAHGIFAPAYSILQ